MPKHGARLIILIVVFLATAVAAKSYFTPDSFYRYGHYRADAVSEIAANEPKYKGPDYCQDCHADRHAEWQAAAHTVVNCETCHSAAEKHPATGKLPVPADSVKLCTLCHEAMPTRPAAHPQIVVAEHAGEEQCVSCHDPHSPGFGEPDSTAGGASAEETASEQCAGCHGDDGRGTEDSPALAGKETAYLARRLRDYKTGNAENAMMNMIADTLDDQAIEALATHYGSLATETAQ